MDPSLDTKPRSLEDTVADPSADGAGPRDVGARLGRYVLLEELGRGAMGVVHVAYDPQLDRRVAIKLLRAERTMAVERRARRQAQLLREAKVLASLAHPHVVTIHDVGMVEHDVFIAMEFVEGDTLRGWIDAQDPSSDAILALFEQAGQGLVAAHAEGIVHRDFKPDNVLVGKDGRVRVTDFGVARLAAPPSASSLQGSDDGHEELASPVETLAVGGLVGTPAYMAPEQLACELVGPAADQFAFCVCLYEALVGERPFAGKSPMDLLDRIRNGPPVVVDGLPRRVDEVVRRGLRADPDARFPSMAALLEQLQRARRRGKRGVKVALMGGLGGLVLAGLALPKPEDPCVEVELPGGWTQEAKASITAAFGRSDRPYAPRLQTEVLAELDDFVDAWSDAASEVCRARADASVSASSVSGSDACLHGHWLEFESTVVLLSEGGDDALPKSLDVIDGLPRPASCLPGEADVAPSAPPLEPHAREGALVVLAGARAAQRAGLLEEAQAKAEEAVALAEPLGDDALLARAYLALGSALASRAMLGEAEQTLHQGLLAAERSGSAELAVNFVVTQALAAGRQRNAALASARMDRARARLQGLGSYDPRLGYQLELRAGDIARMRDDNRTAIAIWDGLEEGLGDDRRSQRLRASLDHRRGAAFYNEGEYDRAVQLWTRARRTWTQVAGPDHPKIAELDTNLAYATYHEGRCQEARERVRPALAQLEETMGAQAPNILPAVSILAHAHACLGEHDEAITLRRRALSLTIRRYGARHGRTFEESMRLAEAYLIASRFEAAGALLEGLEPEPAWLEEDPFRRTLLDAIQVGVRDRVSPRRALHRGAG